MYLKHFGFEKKPFNITPNPDFMFLSGTHKEVFAHLLYGIQNHCGFIAVTGEVGTGKTTVLRTLFKQLDVEFYRLALIFNPRLNAIELLQSINREFGIDPDTESLSKLQSHLNEFLLNENRAGRTVVLVVDEAQNLSPEVLEQIRLLSNLETETDKLIQIVLVGQPELEQMLKREDLRQLKQRITVSSLLEAMPKEDSLRYIQHRINVAGQPRRDLFTPAALKLILNHTGGNPRLINILCDRGLLVCFSENANQVNDKHVRQAQKELWREEGRSTGRLLHKFFYALLILVPLTFAVGFWASTTQDIAIVPSQANNTVKEQPVPPLKTPTPAVVIEEPAPRKVAVFDPYQRLPQIRQALGQAGDMATVSAAYNALARLWGGSVHETDQLLTANEIPHVASLHGLEAASFSGSLGDLLRFNLPALLDLTVPGIRGKRYLTLTGFDGGGFLFSPDLPGIERLQVEELQALWSGRAILLWQNHAGLPSLGEPGQHGKNVEQLQRLLTKAGFYREPLTGSFDKSTIAAVTRFQAESGLVQDGRIGPQTLILLYRAAGYFEAELEASTVGKEEG